MIEQRIPPAELQSRCDEINAQWLCNSNARVELYFNEGDFSAEWKMKLVHRHGSVDHIKAEIADGHTLFLMVQAITNAYTTGWFAGKNASKQAIYHLVQATIDKV